MNPDQGWFWGIDSVLFVILTTQFAIMKTRFCLLILLTIGFGILQAQSNKLVPIFDGKTLAGWRTFQNKPSDSWKVVGGLLYGNGLNKGNHADLITEAEYEHFKLVFDWKISKGGNSGLLYMVNEQSDASFHSGPEYQLLDDQGYPEKIENWQKTGANYAMQAPTMNATLPAGKWNHTVIIVNRGRVEHWLNGKRVVEYELWSDAWNKAKAAGKWKDYPQYGMSKKGHIAIQDHGGDIWLRNIKIQEL